METSKSIQKNTKTLEQQQGESISLDMKTCKKASEIKITWYWHIIWQKHQWNGIKRPEIAPLPMES